MVNSVDDYVRREVRKAKRDRRLGDGDTCISCGTDQIDALRRVDLTQDQPTGLPATPVVGDEHPVGRHNDMGLTARFCKNCQAVYTERQRDHGVNLKKDPSRDPLDKLESLLTGLGAFFLHLVESLSDTWLHKLDNIRQFLDDTYPDWRDAWDQWERDSK